MRRVIIFLGILSLVLTAQPVFAKKDNARGPHPNPNEKAVEHANENARFKRDETWSKGKSDAEKAREKAKKEVEQAKKKAEKEAENAKRKAKKEAEKAKKKAEKESREAQEKVNKAMNKGK